MIKLKYKGSPLSYTLARRVRTDVLTLVLVLASGLGNLAVCAQEKAQQPPARLDAPLTSANSYLQDFGYGVILRIPKILEPSLDFDHLKQPIRADAIAMTFWYPDMTLTNWVAQIDTIFEKQRGTYVPQKDRFRVRIAWMFYSPGEMRNLPPEQNSLMEPGPVQIERNLACCNGQGGRVKMRRIPSGLKGIDAQYAEDWIAKHPGAAIHDPNDGGSYIAKPESPYELSMNCHDQKKGVQCVAHVYSKKHHFQYRMIFPPEAVAHTDDLIRAIDEMIGQWTLK